MWTVLLLAAWLASGPVVATVICRVINHRDQQQPINVDRVRADDQLVEDLRAGHTPDEPIGQTLAAWRDNCR